MFFISYAYDEGERIIPRKNDFPNITISKQNGYIIENGAAM